MGKSDRAKLIIPAIMAAVILAIAAILANGRGVQAGNSRNVQASEDAPVDQAESNQAETPQGAQAVSTDKKERAERYIEKPVEARKARREDIGASRQDNLEKIIDKIIELTSEADR